MVPRAEPHLPINDAACRCRHKSRTNTHTRARARACVHTPKRRSMCDSMCESISDSMSEINDKGTILVTDLDGTLIGRDKFSSHFECVEYVNYFNKIWTKHFNNKNFNNILIYSTGRSLDKYNIATTFSRLENFESLCQLD